MPDKEQAYFYFYRREVRVHFSTDGVVFRPDRTSGRSLERFILENSRTINQRFCKPEHGATVTSSLCYAYPRNPLNRRDVSFVRYTSEVSNVAVVRSAAVTRSVLQRRLRASVATNGAGPWSMKFSTNFLPKPNSRTRITFCVFHGENF